MLFSCNPLLLRLRAEKSVKVSGDFSSDRKALVLGAGYVSAPVVEYLTRDSGLGVTVAASIKAEADAVAEAHSRTEPVLLDIQESPDKLEDLVKSHDIVVSLLPWQLHPKIAEMAIATGTNMVTASYLSEGIKAKHQAAVDAGVTIVNECGVDPGIDHFLAMECFDNVHEGAGKVESFVSFCGGLPAPECSDNPLGYKFSWSPRGALLNMLSGARYLANGEVVDIEENGGLLDAATSMDFLPGFSLEGYPNRDSTIYTDLYGIREAHTVLRGTLRYKESKYFYAESINSCYDGHTHRATQRVLGVWPIWDCLTPTQHQYCMKTVKVETVDLCKTQTLSGPPISWKQYMCHLTNQSETIFLDNLKEILLDR